MNYWAHSSELSEPTAEGPLRWQPLCEHLDAVSELAARLAELARPGDCAFIADARLAGLLHDFGKYSDAFQRRITVGGKKCPHAIHGAILVAGHGNRPLCPQVALAIAGHHAGIPDVSGGESSLAQRIKRPDMVEEAWVLRSRAAADSGRLHAIFDWFDSAPSAHKIDPSLVDLHTRMLFSCLVDADRLNTAGRIPIQAGLEASLRLVELERHLAQLRERGSGSPVQAMRDEVLRDCFDAAENPRSLFSLAVPTGGGKTLAAMAFALRRAERMPERFRRIVVVIPYLSIIEQNARVYREIFGANVVLEHHSGSVMNLVEHCGGDGVEAHFGAGSEENDESVQDRSQRPETENWDAPIVVTTSTRFFESLFSNRPKDLRRVHNLARSIVILDEVQTLPRRLLAPLLKMQRELSEQWGVTFVFSTATQPAFEAPSTRSSGPLWPSGSVTEIVREPDRLRKVLRRTRIEWKLNETMGWSEVADKMRSRPQSLAVVNLRDHALQLYEELAARIEDKESVFHLSTRMCAAHRLRVIDIVRERLLAGRTCHLVSTQLIEAGVDLDFPIVLRALAPLDAIVQAAGRADREGHITASLGRPGGEVVVFLPEDDRMPPHEYKEAAGITQEIARQASERGMEIQVDDADAMQTFYRRYYAPGDEAVMGAKLNALRAELKFATLAAEFEYINSRTRDVFVPDDEQARQAMEELDRIGQLTFDLSRKLQRHSVGLNPTEFEAAKQAGVIHALRPDSEIWIASKWGYDYELGLCLHPKEEAYVVD